MVHVNSIDKKNPAVTRLLRRLIWTSVAIPGLAPVLVVGTYARIFTPDSGYALSHSAEDWARFGE